MPHSSDANFWVKCVSQHPESHMHMYESTTKWSTKFNTMKILNIRRKKIKTFYCNLNAIIILENKLLHHYIILLLLTSCLEKASEYLITCNSNNLQLFFPWRWSDCCFWSHVWVIPRVVQYRPYAFGFFSRGIPYYNPRLVLEITFQSGNPP